jgi:hypothetical protein
VYSFVSSLSYDRPKASSKASPPHSVIQCFLSQFPAFSISVRSCSNCIRLPRHPVTSMLPFIFPSITRFRRQFLSNMWSIKLAVLAFIGCRIFISSLTLLHLSHRRAVYVCQNALDHVGVVTTGIKDQSVNLTKRKGKLCNSLIVTWEGWRQFMKWMFANTSWTVCALSYFVRAVVSMQNVSLLACVL